MNIVDIVILGILGLSILVGLYRGFISSVASMGGCLLSLGLSFWLSPKLAAAIQSNPEILKTLASYTDAATKLGDQTLAHTSVTSLNEGGIAQILDKVGLPAPLNTLLQNLICFSEGFGHRRATVNDLKKTVVRNYDQSVNMLTESFDTGNGIGHTLLRFKAERLRYDTDGQNAELLRDLRYNGSRTGTGTAAHTAGDKYHISTLDHLG